MYFFMNYSFPMKMTDSMHMIKIRILLENAYVG